MPNTCTFTCTFLQVFEDKTTRKFVAIPGQLFLVRYRSSRADNATRSFVANRGEVEQMSSVVADSIQEAIDSRDYEVTFVVKVPARNIGEGGYPPRCRALAGSDRHGQRCKGDLRTHY